MKTIRAPIVHENERLLPTDFLRLMEAVLDVPAQIIQHVLVNPRADGGGLGIVLYGLHVSSVAGAGAPRRVKVSAGACLAPPDAANLTGRATGDATLDSAGWRILVVPSDTLLDLDAAPGPRTDTIQITPAQADEVEENREFRTVAAGGQGVEIRATKTYRRPYGVVEVKKSSDGVPGWGTVLLAKATVDGAGALGAITDLRTLMWPATAGAVGDDSGGAGAAYSRGPRRLLDWLRQRLDTVVDLASTGGLQAAVKVAVGGPALNFTDVALDLTTRRLLGTARWRTGRLRLGGQDQDAADAAAAHWGNDADGLALNGASVPRVGVVVTPTYDGGVYNGAKWAGQNVVSVTRWAQGSYDIEFSADATSSPAFGNLQDSSRWRVVAVPAAHDTNLTAPLTNEQVYQPRNVVPQRVSGSTLRVRCYAFKPDEPAAPGGAPVGLYVFEDFPFSVAIYGPLGAGLALQDVVAG